MASKDRQQPNILFIMVAFSEIHSEGIHGPCFMVRKGKFKYIYVHGHDAQLFDLEADPGE